MPKPPPPDSMFWKLFAGMTKVNTAVFRATRGKVGSRFGKADILLLHHVGAKSGKERVAPLIYLPDGDDLILVASKGGSDHHPGWFHNLRANPDTEVELKGGRRRVHARVATDEERERYWPQLVAIYKPYEDYQGYTQRRIPLVVLEPRA